MDMDDFDAFNEVPFRRRLGWKKWYTKGKKIYNKGKKIYNKVKPYYDAYKATQDEDEDDDLGFGPHVIPGGSRRFRNNGPTCLADCIHYSGNPITCHRECFHTPTTFIPIHAKRI